MENHVESMEGSSPSLDLGEGLQRVLEQFRSPNSPMDAQIQTTEELEENMEVESEPSISEMKIFEQKTIQEGDASTHGSRTTGSLGALGVHDYTEHFTTQQGRGNCGFHAIAALAGYDENDWKTIRQIMLLELTSYASLYEKVLGEKEMLDELHHRLDYFGDGPAPNDKWLTMPDMGHIVAHHARFS